VLHDLAERDVNGAALTWGKTDRDATYRSAAVPIRGKARFFACHKRCFNV
jgi:hypothetical protein